MAPGAEYFKQQQVPLKMKVLGTVNGTKMMILGKGAGDARIGQVKGKWICSKPDVCPMAWTALAPTFAYGYKVFAQYPDNVVQFFQQCMPEGYTQRRITRFSRMTGNDDVEEEGTMTTTHVIQLREGVVEGKVGWVCVNSVNLEANFREGSVLLQNDSLTKLNPSLEKCLPVGDGVKNYVQYFYQIKDAPNDVIIATQMTHNRPFCPTCSHLQMDDPNLVCTHPRKAVPLPSPHYKRTDCKQWKDPKESKDHIWQDEINQYIEFESTGEWKEIGMPEIAEMGGMEMEY